MPDGGFVGESKGDILEALPATAIAHFQRLPAGGSPEDRRDAVRRFQERHSLGFPVVVKPDRGQRGEGVTIARRPEQLERALASPADLIVQEFVAGPELGVFYVRHPGDERGRIFSITRKRLPELRGDGTSTLEELLLADSRAMCLDRHLSRGVTLYLPMPCLAPASPCRSSRSVRTAEGRSSRTAAIAARRLSSARSIASALAYDGFYFGRYDLKAPSIEDFLAGENLRVLELNGVTSEATHVYDPALSVLEAYRVLFRQWRLAFEIGAENRRRGAAVSSLRRLAGLARQHFMGAPQPVPVPAVDAKPERFPPRG